jgi:hypothetical protein
MLVSFTDSWKCSVQRSRQTNMLTGLTLNPDCCIFLSEFKTRLLYITRTPPHPSPQSTHNAWASLHSTRFSALLCLEILYRDRLLAHRPVDLITPKWKPNQFWMCFTNITWPRFLGGVSTRTLYRNLCDKGHLVLCCSVHWTYTVVH